MSKTLANVNPVRVNPMAKLIALDIDGTLLNSKLEISPVTKSALQHAASRGHHIVLASSRPPRSVRAIARALGTPETVSISLGGAFVFDQHVVFEKILPEQIAISVIELARDRALHVSLYSGQDWLVESDDKWAALEANVVGFQPNLVDDLITYSAAVHKLLVMGEAENISDFQHELHQSQWPLDAVLSKPVYCEVTAAAISKAEAIETVAQHFALNLHDVIAFGDGENDLSMIRAAGVGVAMGNALPSVKAVANLVTKSNDEDGIALALEELKLI
jgi:Cof subfamily protein (haloacid dehalogenase superfamily)